MVNENIMDLNLKTKEITVVVDDTDLVIDIAKILKNEDDYYIDATKVLKKHKGDTVRMSDYLRNAQVKKYIDFLNVEVLKVASSPQLKKHGVVWKKPGRYGGTWMHKSLFLNFTRWISPEFEFRCDQVLLTVLNQVYEVKTGRSVLRELQRPLNDQIKKYLVDTGIKNDSAYTQFGRMVKLMVGAPDDRDTYTKTQLDAAKLIVEEYRAMIVHGGKTSLREMNEYLVGTDMNLAWVPKGKK